MARYLVACLKQGDGILCVAFRLDGVTEIHVLNSATELIDEIVIGYKFTKMPRYYRDKAKY